MLELKEALGVGDDRRDVDVETGQERIQEAHRVRQDRLDLVTREGDLNVFEVIAVEPERLDFGLLLFRERDADCIEALDCRLVADGASVFRLRHHVGAAPGA